MKYLLSLFILCSFNLFSQNKLSKNTSIEIIVEAYNFQKEGNYDDAIASYSKININDTNYAAAQFETGTCFIELKKYPESRKVLRSLIEDGVKFDYQHDIYSSIGMSYIREGDSVSALKAYNEGIALYPMDFRLHYNRGIANEKLGNYQEAYLDFIHAIQRNIYYANAHYKLGILAANEEHFAEATLSLMTYLLIEPNSDFSNNVVSFLEKMANGTFNPEPKNIHFSESTAFEAVNLMFKNRIALEKKYKTNFTVSAAYPKQLHFILNNMKYDEKDTDFWNQFYLPIYLKINDAGKLDLLALFSMKSVQAADVIKKVNANKSKLNDFIDWVTPIYNDVTSYQFFDYSGRKEKQLMSYKNKRLLTFGPVNAEKKLHGEFNYYHKNGSLMLKAEYENGDPKGIMEFYSAYNQKKFKELDFNSGKNKKIEKFYYYSGELKEKSVYNDDIAIDSMITYYRNGSKEEFISVGSDQRHGESIRYFRNGSIMSKGNYINGKAEGEYKFYHRNGEPDATYTYKNNLREGKITNFYSIGGIFSVYEYKAGVLNGPYEEYHPNGKLSETGTYKNGVNVNEINSFHTDGTLSSKTILDDKGKENGSTTMYDIDGKKYLEIDYSSGDIKEVRFIDKTGVSKVVATKKGKDLNYKNYYPSGVIRAEGKYENGLRENKWTYFDEYGNISKVEFYKKNNVVDSVIFYHPNGQIDEIAKVTDGQRDGMYLVHSSHGELIEEGYYLKGAYDRERYNYYVNGQMESSLFFVDGVKHGIQKHYLPNGKLKMIEEFDEGLMIKKVYLDTLGNQMDLFNEFNGNVEFHDPTNTYVNHKSYYLNGETNGDVTVLAPNNIVITKGSFSNNNRNGKWNWYFYDGKISEENNYVDGRIEGQTNTYYQNGKISYKSNYKHGVRQGPFSSFYENGQLHLEGVHLDGNRHGLVKSFSPDGSLSLLRMYDKGIIKSYSYNGSDGKPVAFIPMGKESDSVITYHPNKSIAMRHKRVNGEIEGLYLTYYANGQVFEKEMFAHDENHGLSINYYENGIVSFECNYVQGAKDGIEKTYHPNGKLKTEQTFILGDQYGPLKIYNTDGKLTTTINYYDDQIISISK